MDSRFLYLFRHAVKFLHNVEVSCMCTPSVYDYREPSLIKFVISTISIIIFIIIINDIAVGFIVESRWVPKENLSIDRSLTINQLISCHYYYIYTI